MAMSAWQQRPGIDTLMNQYQEDTHAQFGNVRAVKEVSSVANQLGRTRTLSEGYGAGGWDLRFEDMKRIGDWLYVLGINTLDQHLSYVSLRGVRNRDHPQSFSYHEPWWDAYHVSADYFARLSLAMSAGQQVNDVLVLEPTTTAWMYNAGGENPPDLEKLGESFQKLLLAREAGWKRVDAAEVRGLLLAGAAPGFTLTRAPGDRGILFHHRRRLDEGELVFLVNTSTEFRSAGSIESAARGVEEWDLASGVTRPYAFETAGRGTRFRFDLPEAGSLLLFLSAAKGAQVERPHDHGLG